MPASRAFRAVVGFSVEDDCYLAWVPRAPGVIAHGDSPTEAVEELLVAYQLYEETKETRVEAQIGEESLDESEGNPSV